MDLYDFTEQIIQFKVSIHALYTPDIGITIQADFEKGKTFHEI